MRALLSSSTALWIWLSLRVAWGQPTPPMPEEPPRPVWIRLSEGRSVRGRLVGRDPAHHWIRTKEGLVRVRMSDVEILRFDAPPPSPADAERSPRRDLRPWMVAIGGVLFGLSYLGALGGMGKAQEDGEHLAIPVLGPFAYAMATDQGGEAAGLLTFASFLQAGGLALFLVGLASDPPAPRVTLGRTASAIAWR